MMTIEEAHKASARKAAYLREAATKIRLIKEIAKQFDNKVYNCRFDEAVQALSDDENTFYCYNRYNNFEIIFTKRHSAFSVALLGVRAAIKGEQNPLRKRTDIVFTPTKRIMADKMIELLNERYARLLKEASEIETALQNIDEVLLRAQELKKMYNVMVSTLPYEIQNNFNIEHYWR